MRLESCNSKVAVSIDRMRFRWRFGIDFPRFYFIAIRLLFLLLVAEFLAIPAILGIVQFAIPRICAAKVRTPKPPETENTGIRIERRPKRPQNVSHFSWSSCTRESQLSKPRESMRISPHLKCQGKETHPKNHPPQ